MTLTDLFEDSLALSPSGFVVFRINDARGTGEARIPVRLWKSFIEFLKGYSGKPQSKETGVTFDIGNGKMLESFFRIYRYDDSVERIAIRTFLGVGNKPMFLRPEDLPILIENLESATPLIQSRTS
jgi:hypothetical protein